MHLDPSEFNAHLEDIGQDVLWRPSFACPCVNPNSGQAKPACPVCTGKGRVWEPGVECTLGVAGANAQKQWAQFGMNDSGDIVCSVPSSSAAYAIGLFDRVTFLNRTEPFSQNVTKGVNEKIRFTVVSVSQVCWIANDRLVKGTPPVVNPDGTLDWTNAQVPDGVTFSISGRRKTEFYCYYDMPLDRPFHHGATLPRRVVLRRFDRFGAT